MNKEKIKTIIKSKNDLDKFEDYVKIILPGYCSSLGTSQDESYISNVVINQALDMVEKMKEINKTVKGR